MKNFASRTEGIEVSLIRRMTLWAKEEKGVNFALGQGIPSFSLPKEIKEKLCRAIIELPQLNKYSCGLGDLALRRKIASVLRKLYQVKIDFKKEILVTSGAISGTFSTILALIEKGDEVIIFCPAYSSHIEQIKLAGGKPVFVPFLEEKNWRPDFSALEKAISLKTKAILFSNPSNPTGFVFSKKDIEKIIKIARKHDLFIISDETYDFLTYKKKFWSLLSFKNARERSIVCFSFSKKYAMTGFRVGFLVAPFSLLKEIYKVFDEAYICAPTISQYSALLSLQIFGGKPPSQFQKEFEKKRKYTLLRLEKLKSFFQFIPPEGAYYVFPKVNFKKLNLKKIPLSLEKKVEKKMKTVSSRFQTNDLKLSLLLLFGAKVVTIPGIAFGPLGENHLRISFGGEIDQIKEAFDRIEKFLLKIKK